MLAISIYIKKLEIFIMNLRKYLHIEINFVDTASRNS